MIDGIEILSTVQTNFYMNDKGVILAIAICALSFFTLMMGYVTAADNDEKGMAAFFGIMGLLALVGVGISVIILAVFQNHNDEFKKRGPECIYTVLISEDVKFNDFYNKYVIIKQEGEIFTIKEKK
jgi:FtsH-binding integral membrane protein